jgi:hypothetical protein
VATVVIMSFPEGPPTDGVQRFATDGRDAEGTSPTAGLEDSTTAALQADDPSMTGSGSAEVTEAAAPTAATHAGGDAADLDQADRDQTDSENSDTRANAPGGALGPGNSATGAGTALN